MSEAQNASDFFKVVKKILALNNVQIREENNLFFLYKETKDASSSAMDDIYIGYGRDLPVSVDDNQEVMQFVPYNYVKPRNVANLFHLTSLKDIKVYYVIKKIQIIKGKAQSVRKALKLVRLLDKPYLKGKIPYLITFKNIEVKKFLPKMKKIFNLNGITVTDQPSQGGIVMMPIEELNSLYIITPKKEWLEMLLYWKKKLDVESKVEESPRLYIYHVKNRKADELAMAVKEVLGLTNTKHTTDITKKKNVAGEIKKKKTTIAKKESASNAFLISRTKYTPTVTADLDTNILMMKLTPKHYKILLPFIKQLDKLPLQTLVEVTVAEVDMTDTFSLGFEYAIRNKGLGIGDLLNISGGGSGLGIVFNSNKIDATINAFAEKKLLDIVSKPKLLILNNSTGSINVGTQVPIITSETSATDISGGTTPTINRNVTYRTTGIVLGLTPTINSNGVLTMTININLSEAQTNDTSGIDSPLIVNRQLSTVAVIHSGDTILIGGLISHNKSRSKGGIPYLKDIPFIGGMFATQSHKITKTELIMLIHPVIIESPKGLTDETKRFKILLNYINLEDL
jgi:general secretion pathway protein D